MRRGVSIAVLLVVLASALAPLAQANASSVPACCRVGGPHHCMGMPAGLDGFHSLPSKCPYRIAPAVTSPVATLIRVRLAISRFATETIPAPPQSIDPFRIALVDVQKRGPPIA